MKDPYAPAFWCALAILGVLSGGYFFGIRSAYDLHRAELFLYAAAGLIVAAALVTLAWIAWQHLRLNRRELVQSHTLVTIWNTKVALRRVETVFDRYLWGSHWHCGRTFEEVMGELRGTPLDQSLEALKQQCRELDRELRDGRQHWQANARDLSSVAAAMTRERYRLDVGEPSAARSATTAVLNRDIEVLVYTWSARLRSFDHQLDDLERAYH